MAILINGKKNENPIAMEYKIGEIKNNFFAIIFTSRGNTLACKVDLCMP